MDCVTFRLSDYPELEKNGFYFQLTYGRKLMTTHHRHEFFEIIYVVDGACEQFVNGMAQILRQGSMVWLRPGDSHWFVSQEAGANLLSFSVSREVMGGYFAAYDPELTRALLEVSEPPRLYLNARQSGDFLSEQERILTMDRDERAACERLLLGEAVHLLLRNQKRPGDGEAHESFWEALNQMRKRENIALGVEALLRLSSFSHAQLCRLTKRYLGVSPQHYVMELRLNLARELLENADLTVEDVARTVGYASASHFNQLFRKRFGLTPAAVRQAARQNAARLL